MSEPLTIYQILEKNQFNTGSVHQMFQAATGLRQRGHRVTIVSRPDDTLSARAAAEGIAFEPLPLRNELDLGSIVKLRRLVARDDVDVIHVHKGRAHTLALAATIAQPVPCFVVNRGVSFPLTLWNRAKYRTRRVDRIVTVCQQIKDVVVESGRVPAEKVEVVYAGVDLSIFSPQLWSGAEFRKEKEIALDAFVVLQVGVRDWKGWRELIDAFATFAATRPQAHLLFIGCRNDAERSKVMSYAVERGVAGRVTAAEYRTDMARVLSAADCVVDASWAGTGVTGTIREAMALGKPVIATDCGGNRELVSSPEFGWMVPARDHVALSGAMAQVASDPDKSLQVASAGMARVRQGFSMTGRIDRLEALYRSVLATKR